MRGVWEREGVEVLPRPLVLRSAMLDAWGVPHCFTTRVGGYSTGVFATLNFGNPSELPVGDSRRDPPETIARNIELVLHAMGTLGREVVQVHQVHGDGVHAVRVGEATHAANGVTTKADAIVTDDAGRVACVRVADCAPVLIAGRSRGGVIGVAAVHAGWRGCVAGVAERAVERLRALGAAEFVSAVGPCIGREAFEVGPEVAAAFQERFGSGTALVRERGGQKFDVDLAGALCEQLRGSGVAAEAVGGCTASDAERFFSHRRDRGMTGRMAGFVGMPGREVTPPLHPC
jgi:polyphenol oxidase